MSLFYFHEQKLSKNAILSCDNIRTNFVLRSDDAQDFLNHFFNHCFRPEIKTYPASFADMKYRYFAEISYEVFDIDGNKDIAKCAIGYCFNGYTKTDDFGQENEFKGYIDFNPNKLGSNERFLTDYAYIKQCSEVFKIPRCDIALDIRTARRYVAVRKDQRKYSLEKFSEDNLTEYLGVRNNPGRVKIYNKTLESKLDYDLTRIEVTTEPYALEYLQHFPKVLDFSIPIQRDINIANLTPTDLALLKSLDSLMSYDCQQALLIFDDLPYRKKQKLEPFFLPESLAVPDFVELSLSSTSLLFLEILRTWA